MIASIGSRWEPWTFWSENACPPEDVGGAPGYAEVHDHA